MGCACVFSKGLLARSRISLETHTEALAAYVSSQKWEQGVQYCEENNVLGCQLTAAATLKTWN